MGLNADQLLGRVMQLNASVESLAALAAELRCRAEGITVEADTRDALAAVAAELTGGIDAPPAALRAAAAAARAFLRQALELAERPEAPGGWRYSDPLILEAQGQGSVAMVGVFEVLAPQLPGLAARLASPKPRFLDVGTGVGRLAIAMAERHASLHVLGIDIWKPALELARRNVGASSSSVRVEIREEDVCVLTETDAFDLAWLPGPFLPAGMVPDALRSVLRALRRGGWLLFGVYDGGGDPMARHLSNLRTLRSGGRPWPIEALTELISDCGFETVSAPARSWNAPMRIVAGRKPDGQTN